VSDVGIAFLQQACFSFGGLASAYEQNWSRGNLQLEGQRGVHALFFNGWLDRVSGW
jgi:hypothetical protein